MSKYIIPEFRKFSNFKDLINYKPQKSFFKEKDENDFFFRDFFNENKAFVLGDPGCGKSRLFEEISLCALSNSKICHIIKLNHIEKHQSIQEFIKARNLNIKNEKNYIICFDALDETDLHDFSYQLNRLENFIQEYSNISVYISCRSHYFINKVIGSSFTINISYLLVQTLDEHLVDCFLNENVENDNKLEIIEVIKDKIKGNKESSIFNNPRYLNIIVNSINKAQVTLQEIKAYKRCDFFEIAIYHQLKTIFDKKEIKAENEKYILKRVLEKIALVMEIYQRNRIKKEELISILDDLNSNLNLVFLEYCDVDTFISRVMKDEGEYVEFENTEFQEYLAAKELIRLGKTDQIVFDLAIEKRLNHIYKNWYDVLRYVVELDAKQLVSLISLLKVKKDYLVEEDYYKLLDGVDINQLSKDDKAYIFDVLYTHFQNSVTSIHYRLNTLLNYYQNTNYTKFFSSIPENSDKELLDKILTNHYYFISFLISLGKFNDVQKEFWINIFKEQVLNSSYKNVQVQCLYPLGGAKEYEFLLKIREDIYKYKDKSLTEAYIHALDECEIYDTQVIDFYISAVKNGSKNAVYALNGVNTPQGLEYLMNSFNTDQELFNQYLDKQRRLILGCDRLFNNINSFWTEKIETLLFENLKIIFNLQIHYRADDYLDCLISILISKSTNFVKKLFLQINDDCLFEMDKKLLKDLSLDQTLEFIKEYKDKFQIDNLDWYLHNFISEIFHSNNPNKDSIINFTKVLFPNVSNWPSKNEINPNSDINKNSLYNFFKKKLEPKPGYYKTDVFEFYFKNRSELDKNITSKEKALLIDLLVQNFNSINLDKFKISIDIKSEDVKEYNISNVNAYSIGIYVLLIEHLSIEDQLKDYRDKLIDFLPILNDYNNFNIIEKVLTIIGNLSQEEANRVYSLWEKRTDDLLYSSTSSFIKTIKKLEIKAFTPFILKCYESPKTTNYEKKEALKCLGSKFAETKVEFFKEIFEKHSTEQNIRGSHADLANQFLISNFKDENAIVWRFNYLKKNVIEWDLFDFEGTRGVSDDEVEMDNPSFFNCVIELKEPSLLNKFLDLLQFSFDLRKTRNLIKYSNYIQTIVFEYFISIPNFLHLNDLKRTLSAYKDRNLSRSFFDKLRDIEVNIIENNRPTNISLAINEYNQVKSKAYAPISYLSDLAGFIEDSISEITNVIEDEGLYQPLGILNQKKQTKNAKSKSYFYPNEDLIQKTLKIQLENILLNKGIRNTDIYREVELYDGKRTDLLVKYGFIGPSMIELKLSHNFEITNDDARKLYKEKLKKYISATNSMYSYYIILKVRKGGIYDKQYICFQKLIEEYSDIENLRIRYIDCTKK